MKVKMLIMSLCLVGCATTSNPKPQKLDTTSFIWGCFAGILNQNDRIETKDEEKHIWTWCEMVEKAFRKKNNIVEEP